MGDWMQKSAEIYEQIMHAGWNEQKQSFVQYYGSDAIDASALLMVLTNFAGSTDPRILSTIDRIQKDLTEAMEKKGYNADSVKTTLTVLVANGDIDRLSTGWYAPRTGGRARPSLKDN